MILVFAGTFEDDDVTHVEGDVNPVRDLEIIYEELRLKDEETLMKNIDKVERVVARGGDKKMKPEYVSSLLFFLSYLITFDTKTDLVLCIRN